MKNLLFSMLCLCFLTPLCAINFLFSGTGNWTDVANWSPSYPGTTLLNGDIATISNGATCTIPIGINLIIEGRLNNLERLEVYGSLENRNMLDNNSASINNYGTIINRAGFDNTGTVTNTSMGLLENLGGFIDSYSQIINNGTLINDAAARIDNHTRFQNFGGIYTNNGVMNNYSSYQTDATCQYNGTGLINGNFIIQSGLFSPNTDTDAGTHTLNGNFDQATDGRYLVNINNNAGAGLGHDIINISGTATLNGTFVLDFDNFTPCVGERYTIMTFSSYTGLPSVTITGISATLGTHIMLNFTATSITASIVAPLPNAACVDAKVFLQGPLSGTSMAIDLNTASLIPLTEPYSGLGYTPYNTGINLVSSLVSPLADPMVDWILLELRSTSTPTVVAASSAALVLRSGKVVDINGSSAVTFGTVANGNYHLAVRHRNHLGAMTNTGLVNVP